VEEQASGAKDSRPKRAEILKAARRREIDVVLVWKLDRWGRSMADLATTLNELQELGVGFVSLTEALDFTTPSGRAMAGLLGVFADYERELIRERVKAGIAHARANGKPHGRPAMARDKAESIRKLAAEGLSQGEIARRLLIHRRSVGRVLANRGPAMLANVGIHVEHLGVNTGPGSGDVRTWSAPGPMVRTGSADVVFC